jgi:NAD(P)-dependent dehydrogenase (short-subunit alcohol dehydrogenase family)
MLERPFSLEGKCILVVGAGTGIGKGVALELARQGADVALSYSGSYQGAMEAVEQIKAFGRRAVALQANIGLVADCRRVVDGAVQFLGGLDGLFNNAGLTFTKPIELVTEEEFNRIYEVNIDSSPAVATGYMLERVRLCATPHLPLAASSICPSYGAAGTSAGHSAGTKARSMLGRELAVEMRYAISVAGWRGEMVPYFKRPQLARGQQHGTVVAPACLNVGYRQLI